jgi:hypothetical protein
VRRIDGPDTCELAVGEALCEATGSATDLEDTRAAEIPDAYEGGEHLPPLLVDGP